MSPDSAPPRMPAASQPREGAAVPMPARPWVRPMRGWWQRDPHFLAYMARELTAFAVLAYAVVLAVGLVRLAQGPAAWDAWLQAVRSPAGVVLHLVCLASFVVHAKSWFEILPKTLPILWLRGRRVAAGTITRIGFAAALAANAALLLVVRGVLS